MAKKSEIAKAILSLIGVLGVLTVAIVAPGVVNVIIKELKHNKYSKSQVKRSFEKLQKSKLISITKEGDKTVVHLTKLGKEKFLKFKLEDMRIKPQTRWDKKWRLVIFDIPEDFHVNRSVFTRKLREIGFRPLQKSIWVTPYPCEDEVDFLKEIYLIGKYMRIITAESIDIQDDLKKSFGLA